MTQKPLKTCPGISVFLLDTPEPRLRVLRVDVSDMPSMDVMDEITTTTTQIVRDCDGRLVLHLRHVDTETLTPPDLPRLVMIAGKLMEARSDFDAKVKGTVVETKKLDDFVRAAKNALMSLFQPRGEFSIVDTPAESTMFVDGLVEREQAKRLAKT